tara:strand:+ start:414 stop:836 length:423 start_codon:yes stop_codon:yes gene_type:complete
MDNNTVQEQGEVIGKERINNTNYGQPTGAMTTMASPVTTGVDNAEREIEMVDAKSSNVADIHNATYIEIISEKDETGQPLSVLEVDLIISREKGKETRRLAMNFTGIDVEKQKMIENSVNINRESFEQLKNFFSNLDWNS